MESESIFILLFFKIVPLYLMIGLGVIAGTILKISKEAISKMLIYIISPLVIFYGVYTVDFQTRYLVLPFLFFGISSLLSLLFLKIGTFFYGDNATKNILSMGVGTGNTGYFGFPVVIALFGTQAFSVAVFMQMGITIFENILGFFIVARGHHSIAESLKKIFRLPSIYAFFLGLVFSGFGMHFGARVDTLLADSFVYFKGAYSMLGMMMIGFGISSCRVRSIDMKFISLILLGRSVIYPLIIAVLITFDRSYFHIFERRVYEVAVIMALVPLAANLVAYSVELRVFPDKAAVAVLVSTSLALLYIPFVLKLILY